MSIQPNYIVPELRATERHGAIREMLRHLVSIGAIPAHAEDSLFQAFRHREEVMTTGVGFGLAIPHISSEVVTKRIVAFGRSRSGIEFASIDGKPAKAVFLMISPTHRSTTPDT